MLSHVETFKSYWRECIQNYKLKNQFICEFWYLFPETDRKGANDPITKLSGTTDKGKFDLWGKELSGVRDNYTDRQTKTCYNCRTQTQKLSSQWLM